MFRLRKIYEPCTFKLTGEKVAVGRKEEDVYDRSKESNLRTTSVCAKGRKLLTILGDYEDRNVTDSRKFKSRLEDILRMVKRGKELRYERKKVTD